MTHDTKKALVQTMQGLSSICTYLLNHAGFQYVLLRELQSDRNEGEFSVYRQSTGANVFMTCGDVMTACKRRLARYAASYLETLKLTVETTSHTCVATAIDTEDATFIEECTEPSLSVQEESSAAYVAGWLEMKCTEHLNFTEEDKLVPSPTEVSAFIEEVSRGSLKIPHQTTFDLVWCGLAFMIKARHTACCRRRLMMVLQAMENYNDLKTSDQLRQHLANVLLSGLHNLERDQKGMSFFSRHPPRMHACWINPYLVSYFFLFNFMHESNHPGKCNQSCCIAYCRYNTHRWLCGQSVAYILPLICFLHCNIIV